MVDDDLRELVRELGARVERLERAVLAASAPTSATAKPGPRPALTADQARFVRMVYPALLAENPLKKVALATLAEDANVSVSTIKRALSAADQSDPNLSCESTSSAGKPSAPLEP